MSLTDALGRKTSYTYDAKGNPLTKTDPDGQVTSFKYTVTDLLKEIAYANGATVTYKYDQAGRVTDVFGPEGQNRYFYDSLGRILAATDILGRRFTYEYGPAGRTSMTSPDGKTVAYDYDVAGRLKAMTDWDENVVSFTYDALGRPSARTVSNGLTTRYGWTDDDRLSEIATFGSTGDLIQGWAYEYDAAGNTGLRRLLGDLSILAAALPTEGATEGDGEGEGPGSATGKSTKAQGKGKGSGGGKGAEEAGEAQEAEAAGVDEDAPEEDGTEPDRPEAASTAFAYDALNRLVQAMDLLADGSPGETREYAYDPVGNRLSLRTTKPGGELDETTYQYDAANRLVGLVTGDGDARSFTYDPRDNLLSITGVDAEDGEEKELAAYVYDIVGRLISFQDWRGQEASFTYDPEGNRMSRVQKVFLRGPGRGNAYGHDHAPGQQEDFVPPGQEGGSTPPGQEKESPPPGQGKKPVVYEPPVTTSGGYRLLAHGGSDQWSLLSLAYAPKDDKGQGDEDRGNGGGGGQGNDQGNGQPGGDHGNQGGQPPGGGNGNGGNAGCNESPGGNGNPDPKDQGKGNAPDKEKGQGQGKGPDKDKEQDKGNSQDKEKGGNNGKAKFIAESLYFVNDLADPLGRVALAHDETGLYKMANVWDPVSGDLVRTGSPDAAQWVLTDVLGSVTGLLSDPASMGRLDWHATYDEFGQPMSARKFDPSFPQGSSYLGFTGEPYDFASGLTYLRNRYYAPSLGRFTSADPMGAVLGTPSSLNAFTYALNNPLKWVDPWGLSPGDGSSYDYGEGSYTDSGVGDYIVGAVAGAAVTRGIASLGTKFLGGLAAANPVAAAIIGGGLLAAGTIGSYYQRKQEQIAAGTWGKWSGLKTTLAAVGDVVGVSQLIEGLTGKRLLTGKDLSPGRAGWQLGTGLGVLLSWGTAIKKLLTPDQQTVPEEPLIQKNRTRGLEFENRVLEAEGLEKYRGPVIRQEGQAGFKPESLRPDAVVEAKSQSYIYRTPQLDAEMQFAKDTGRVFTLYTDATRSPTLSGPLVDEIMSVQGVVIPRE